MKKITALLGALFLLAAADAQTVYDAVKLADKDLNGTARFVGMGGAMGALGGDISTIGTNPAGIGIFRSNDVMTSFSFSTYETESKYEGRTFDRDRNRWSFDNIGIVLARKISNVSPLRYVNFGFNYKRTKSFYKNMSMSGLMGTFDSGIVSQVNYMAQQATDAAQYVSEVTKGKEDLDFDGANIYNDADVGWLGILGWQGSMIGRDDNEYYSLAASEPNSLFDSREKGGIDQYDFNLSFNLYDRLYLGVTFGIYSVNYKKYSAYDEAYSDDDGLTGEGYLLESFNKIKGNGFDLKFGLIARPFESSPLRIGLAVHTPTFYDLTYTTRARMTTDYPDSEGGMVRSLVDTYSRVGDMDRDYRLHTPWEYNVSLGYTVGNWLAVGAEYEYEDYSTMKFKYPEYDGGGEMGFETSEVRGCLKGAHTLRVGLEYKPSPDFAFRLGYNRTSSMFEDDAVKYLATNSVMTDTDFANKLSQNDYTVGIGYRNSNFYADLAYQLSAYKENFYPFINEFETTAGWTVVTPPSTKAKVSRNRVLLTLGYRF